MHKRIVSLRLHFDRLSRSVLYLAEQRQLVLSIAPCQNSACRTRKAAHNTCHNDAELVIEHGKSTGSRTKLLFEGTGLSFRSAVPIHVQPMMCFPHSPSSGVAKLFSQLVQDG